MKFEKLNETKIRIILTLKDLELNNITAENIFSNSDASQKLLENMITEAEKKIGFKPGDSKLLVEAVMSACDECTITITKLRDEDNYFKYHPKSFIFKFDYFDDFINLCTFLKNLPNLDLKELSKNFSLIFYNGTYYLQALDIEKFSVVLEHIRCFFAEFGKDVSNSASIDGILSEYGKVVFSKNAIINCAKKF